MRIIYILTTLGIGGAEKQVIDIAERMAARGHTVALLVLKHSGEEWPVTLPVLRLNLSKTIGGVWSGLRFAANFVLLIHPELIHSHTFPANIFARMLRLRLSRRGIRPLLINTIHNVYEGGWHRMMLYQITDRAADAITSVSQAAAARFIRINAVPRHKITVLTNGVDTDYFVSNTRTRRQTRSLMQAESCFIWIAVGRLAPAKDYSNLLRAFSILLNAHPTARLWIVGEGDASQQSSLQDALERHPMPVELLGLRHDVRELLDAADGFVLSSAWEGMPLAVAEAMAMGKPVVATDVGGVRELVADTGLLVPAHNSQALTDSMSQIMLLPDTQRVAMGRAAHHRVIALFSLSAKVDQWEQFYRLHLHGRAS